MYLRELKSGDLDKAARLMHSVSLQRERASYPLHLTITDAQDELQRRIRAKHSYSLGCFSDEGALSGLLLFFFEPESRYLQTTAFIVPENNPACYSEFLKYIYNYCPGYDVHIGIAEENTRTADFLYGAGFSPIESCHDTRLHRRNFSPSAVDSDIDIRRIAKDSFDRYAPFHDRFYGDIYWNSARIEPLLDSWLVFAAYVDKEIVAGVFLNTYEQTAEIFGMAAYPMHEGLLGALLSRSIGELFLLHPEIDEVVYLIEKSGTPTPSYALSAALGAGFNSLGGYSLFLRRGDRSSPCESPF